MLEFDKNFVRKRKLHQLVHLPEQVRRYGPPQVFSAERFESFNGHLRQHSMKSNRKDPSKHLATQFLREENIRLILSGGYFFNNNWCRGGQEIRSLFSRSEDVRRAFGMSFLTDES